MRRLGGAVAAIVVGLAVLGAVGTTAKPARVTTGTLVLLADGRFDPHTLPRGRFAPIDFRGRIDLSAKRGAALPALRRVVLDIDRDGRLAAGGLATCAVEQIADASSEEARRRCASAQVGSGRMVVLVSLLGVNLRAGSPLSLFNGPRQRGMPTILAHVRVAVPLPETLTFVIPIERRKGNYAYRALVDLPEIAGGLGAITHLDFALGRRYRVGGTQRSYLAARCSREKIDVHGRFSFADGTIIEGTVERPCFTR